MIIDQIRSTVYLIDPTIPDDWMLNLWISRDVVKNREAGVWIASRL